MKVIGIQPDVVWENKAANHAKIITLIEKAGPPPGSLVLLPEMFATGFSMNVAGIHDSETRETQDFLARTAMDYRIYLLGGVVTKSGGGRGRNECLIYSPDGREIARYAKLQPFTLGGESDNYEAGRNISIFDLGEFKISTFICYDLRFPEIFRAACRQGVNLYTVIASWPVAREEHWVTLLKARAIENQAFVVGINRSGRDPYFEFPGRSMIISPAGKPIAEAGREEGWISAELNIEELLRYRSELPFLKDMKKDYELNEINKKYEEHKT
jgi:omega-amidase